MCNFHNRIVNCSDTTKVLTDMVKYNSSVDIQQKQHIMLILSSTKSYDELTYRLVITFWQVEIWATEIYMPQWASKLNLKSIKF